MTRNTNRYIEDTIDRAKSVAKSTADFEDSIILYDSQTHRTDITSLYNLGKTYHLQDYILLILMHGNLKMQVNNKEITLSTRSCIYIPAFSVMRIMIKSMETQFFLYRFGKIARTTSVNDLYMYDDRVSAENVYYKKLNDQEYNYLKTHYDELAEGINTREFKHRDIFVRSYNNILRIFITNLFEIDSEIKGDAISRQENLFRQFIELLNQYASKEREVQFYAKQLDITPKYLSTITNTYSGKNASTWIAEYVVTLAKQLMKEKHCKIQEVSVMLNFPSQSFFGRFFKRTAGISPKRYMLTELK